MPSLRAMVPQYIVSCTKFLFLYQQIQHSYIPFIILKTNKGSHWQKVYSGFLLAYTLFL